MAAAKVLRLRPLKGLLASGIPVFTYKVYAANGDDSSTTKPKKLTAVNKLPIYENPEEKHQYQYVEEETTTYKKKVSEFRVLVWKQLDSMKTTTDYICEKWEVGVAHTKGAIEYLQNDPGVLPRIGVIAVSGLGGIVLGYKGGVLRKTLLSTTLMLSAAAVCYPNEAVAISTSGYDKVVALAKDFWQSSGPGSSGKSKDESKDKGES
ncbi:hypothetical protein CHS0354_014007 [Potamilus streckersoni]|uniref:MICOS complex subunit n=1 Tax=Potamilus streckersoni TaxID=2493646 RepID=A0AAE0TK90_9BIVA|nr:hypothetical protein CHS0354_014007 [Potamilus streckersoni]